MNSLRSRGTTLKASIIEALEREVEGAGQELGAGAPWASGMTLKDFVIECLERGVDHPKADPKPKG